MTEQTTTHPALSWRMTAPSTSGGKVYKILVVDNLLVVGWGSVNNSARQYSVKRFRSAAAARDAAAEQTAAKEAKGYHLSAEPYRLDISERELNIIRSHTRGSSAFLDRIF